MSTTIDKYRQALLEGLQRNSPTKGTRARTGRDHAGQSGWEEVQELGGDDELHEFGQICEGNMHEDGKSDAREQEVTLKKAARYRSRSSQSNFKTFGCTAFL